MASLLSCSARSRFARLIDVHIDTTPRLTGANQDLEATKPKAAAVAREKTEENPRKIQTISSSAGC
jgi:hypothetical protein